MNLLFDLKATQPNTSGKRHGGGRYGEIIYFRMIERHIKFACFYDSKLWLNPEVQKQCQHYNIPLYDLQKESIEDIIRNHNIDRLYSCLPGKLAKLTSCEVYGTVHGLREFETPFDNIFYQYKNSFKETLKFTINKLLCKQFHNKKHNEYLDKYIHSQFHLITVSEHSKNAFLSYFPELENQNFPVFYSPNTSSKEKAIKKRNNEKYFFLVSGNRWEKNNLRAIIAFDRLADYNCMKDIRMKVTGTKGDCFRYKIKHPDRFDFLGYVDDQELESLYANAYIFVYPSLNEGFGYPPLEAMRYKIPVIASPLSSIAETCSGGAFYFNPFSVEEIMNRMLMLITNPNLYSDLSQKGYEQYLKISKRQIKDLDLLIDYIQQ